MLNNNEDRELTISKPQFKFISIVYQFIIAGGILILIYSLIWSGKGVKAGVDILLNQVAIAVSSFKNGSKGLDEGISFLKMVREPFLFFVLMYIGFIVHRLLHALGYFLFGHLTRPDIVLQSNSKILIPFVNFRLPIGLSSHRRAILFPGVVLGIIPILAGLVFNMFLVLLWGVIQLVASIGDFTLAWKIRRLSFRAVSREISIIGHPAKTGSYIMMWHETGARQKADNPEKDMPAAAVKVKNMLNRHLISPVIIFSIVLGIMLTMYIPFNTYNTAVTPVQSLMPEDKSRGGNSTGNISNKGNAAIADNWIYYANSGDGNKLYRIKTDGTGKTLLSDDKPLYLNVLDDWIYYSNTSENYALYKIKADGSGRTLLEKHVSECINVSGDWIYFSLKGIIYKIKTDGSSKTKLVDDLLTLPDMPDDVPSLVLNGDWIYYRNAGDGEKLYKVKTDGSGRTKLDNHKSAFINAEGDWIYFTNKDYNIYRIRTDGSGKKLITAGNLAGINLAGDWIYYSNTFDAGKLYKIKADGSGAVKLSDFGAADICVLGEWIYFINEEVNGYLYKVRTDGSGCQPVK